MKPGPAISIADDVGGRVGVEHLHQGRGQGPGIGPGLLGRDQGDVGRPVAVLPTGRALEVDRGRVDVEVEAVPFGDGGDGAG